MPWDWRTWPRSGPPEGLGNEPDCAKRRVRTPGRFSRRSPQPRVTVPMSIASVFPIGFVSLVSFVSVVALVSVVSLCDLVHKTGSFSGEQPYSRIGLWIMHEGL